LPRQLIRAIHGRSDCEHPELEEKIILDKVIVWARSLIERRLNRPYIQFICLSVLVVYLVLLLVSFATSVRGRTIFGPYLGADFGAFYIAGKIFNTDSPGRIYDAALHHQLYQEQFPDAPPDSQLPYVNAPFFVLPFTVLARFPYAWAYLFWLLLSLALYVTGFAVIWRTLDAIPRDVRSIALLLALSFTPFLVECLAGGQTSAVGFFCLAFAISSERRGRHVLCGLAISLCAYKPTLLVLIVPMLVITRRVKTLLGLVVGCGILALISLLVVGSQGCLGYISTLLYFTNASTSAASGLRSWKYVDVNSFFRLLLGQHSYLRWTMTMAAFLFGLPFLLRSWWRGNRERRDEQSLIWALTITGTLVLNLYVGIYDSTLVVLSVLLTTDVLFRRSDNDKLGLPETFKFILLLLYVVPWITQPIARLIDFQPYTLALALLGSWQLIQFQRLKEAERHCELRTAAGEWQRSPG
jgi:Glycosyltransferase family 87